MDSTYGFDFYLFTVIDMSFCIDLPNFIQIEQHMAELWRHIDFSKWRPAAILDLIWIIVSHPRNAIGLSLILIFRLIVFTVLEILWFLFFRVLAWNCLFTSTFLGGGWREYSLKWRHPLS